jgi:hypothetical protein
VTSISNIHILLRDNVYQLDAGDLKNKAAFAEARGRKKFSRFF